MRTTKRNAELAAVPSCRIASNRPNGAFFSEQKSKIGYRVQKLPDYQNLSNPQKLPG